MGARKNASPLWNSRVIRAGGASTLSYTSRVSVAFAGRSPAVNARGAPFSVSFSDYQRVCNFHAAARNLKAAPPGYRLIRQAKKFYFPRHVNAKAEPCTPAQVGEAGHVSSVYASHVRAQAQIGSRIRFGRRKLGTTPSERSPEGPGYPANR